MPDISIDLRGRAVTFVCIALTLGLVACAADPSARRNRRLMSEEEEIAQGEEAAQQVKQYMGFAGTAELNEYVDRIVLHPRFRSFGKV